MVDMISKPRYDEYVAYLEGQGLTREHFNVNELNTNIVTLTAVAAGATTLAVDVLAPAGQAISILGTNQVSMGADYTSAYPLVVRFADSSDNEVSFRTNIRITKESISEALKPIERVPYAAVNMTKSPGLPNVATTTYKTNNEYYRFPNSIELTSNQRLRLYIANTVGTVATPSVTAAIPTTNMSFSLAIDLWSGMPK